MSKSGYKVTTKFSLKNQGHPGGGGRGKIFPQLEFREPQGTSMLPIFFYNPSCFPITFVFDYWRHIWQIYHRVIIIRGTIRQTISYKRLYEHNPNWFYCTIFKYLFLELGGSNIHPGSLKEHRYIFDKYTINLL